MTPLFAISRRRLATALSGGALVVNAVPAVALFWPANAHVDTDDTIRRMQDDGKLPTAVDAAIAGAVRGPAGAAARSPQPAYLQGLP
jgi:hypothetical protein